MEIIFLQFKMSSLYQDSDEKYTNVMSTFFIELFGTLIIVLCENSYPSGVLK